MKNKITCNKCLLTETTPGIKFDRNGICNYCNTYKPMEVLGEHKLIELFNSEKAKKNKYDCLLGLSGGRDSTYALWKLVEDYGMNVLAVNYNNPFMSKQAYENIKNAIDILKVDYITWQYPNDAHKKSTIKALRVWSHHPSSALIPIVCAHCKTTWPTFFKIARANNISLAVMGSNPLETATFKRASMGGARTYHKISKVPKIIKTVLKELIANPRYITNCSWSLILKAYLMASHSTPYLKWRYKDIKVIRLFDYIRWNEQQVLTTIKNNLRWQKSSEIASSWRFDCRLDYVRRLMYTSTVGVTELRDLFSKMVRENIITRAEAIERLKTEDIVPYEIADSVLVELGLILSDLNINA